MTKFITVFILSVFFILFASCNSVSPELKTAEQLIESAPDSALQILRNMPPQKYKNPKNRALYGLLMVQAKNNLKQPLISDSLLDFSISYFQEHPSSDCLATCYFYKGRIYKYTFQYEKAMNYYLRANDELKNNENCILLGRINFDIGDINNIQGEYAMARSRYMISYNYFTQARLHPQAFYSLLNIGRTYYESKNYRKASDYYRKIIQFANDSLQQGALYQEMGLNFYDSKRFDSALFYFRKIIKFPYLGNNRAIRYNLLADLFYNLKNIDSSYFYATNAFKFKPPVRTQRECYRILTNCEFKRGHLDSVTLYMNKYVALGDSLRKIDAQAKGSYIETVHLAKIEVKKNRSIIMLLAALSSLVIVCAYILYRLIIRRNKKEKILIKEIHTCEKADIRKKVIVDKQIILQQKIEEKKIKIMTERKGINLQEREDLIKEMYNEILHINDLKFFFGEMDIDFNNLVTKLQSRYKGINEKELIWCCLNLLKIPNHDLLILLNYKTQNSLKILKSRLSVKFKLDNAKQLSEFLINILAEE